MRKICKTLLILLTSLPAFAQYNYSAIHPRIGSDPFFKLLFVSEDVGYAVGKNKLCKTTNGGKNWNDLVIKIDSLDWEGISAFFINENIGFIAAPKGRIFKTVDGGYSFELLHRLNLSSSSAMIYFISETSGFHIERRGNGGKVLRRTEDGGHTWHIVASTGKYYDEYVCSVVNKTLFKIQDGALVAYSKDRGDSWNPIVTDNVRVSWGSLTFIDSLKGYFVGTDQTNSFLIRTIDGGLNWTTTSTLPGVGVLHFISERKGYLTTDSDGSFETNDGGQTWHKFHYQSKRYGDITLWGLTHVDSLRAFAFHLDDNIVITTVDGGESWQLYTEKITGATARSIDFSSSDNPVVVGDKGLYITRKNDRWIKSEIGTNSDLMRVAFSSGHGVIVSTDGAIYGSHDLGATWAKAFTGSDPLYSLAGLDNIFVAGGARGKVLLSRNGGVQWTDISFKNTASDLIDYEVKDLEIVDDNTFIAVGGRSRALEGFNFILITSNGGSSWSQVYTDSDIDIFTEVTKTSSETIFASKPQALFRSENAGKTWSQVHILSDNMHHIRYMNALHGKLYAVVIPNVIVSEDNGSTWSKVAELRHYYPYFSDGITDFKIKDTAQYYVGRNGLVASNTNEHPMDSLYTETIFRYRPDLLASEEVGMEVSVNLFPNPTSGLIAIEPGVNVSDSKATDVMGKIVPIDRIDARTFDFSNVPDGVYILNLLVDSGKILSKKVVVLRK